MNEHNTVIAECLHLALLTQICLQAKIKWETISACQKIISSFPLRKYKNGKGKKRRNFQMKTINFIVETLFQCLMGIVVRMPHDPIPFQQLNPLIVCLLPLLPPTPFHEQFSHNVEDPTIFVVEDTRTSLGGMPCIHDRSL